MRNNPFWSLRSRSQGHWSTLVFYIGGISVSILWMFGAEVWPGIKAASGVPSNSSAMTATLMTLATISATSLVLSLTAALVGLQMLSRYGSQASRMVMDKWVAVLMVIAGTLGIALPIWATVEPSAWLMTLGFAVFSWSLFTLAIASYLILSRLNPQWLTLHTIRRAFPLSLSVSDKLSVQLGKMQSTLLEIAAGTDEAESDDRRVTLRAIALVGLARYRIDATNTDLLQLVDALAERTRSPNTAKGLPEETAALLSLLALASNDSEVMLGVLKAIHELVQDAIQQQQPVRRSLLDEAAGLVTNRLHVLLDPATIDWLVAQEPIEQQTPGLVFTVPDEQKVTRDTTGRHALAIPNHVDWDVIRDWLEIPQTLNRKEWKVLSVLVPVYPLESEEELEETVELIDVSTLIKPDDISLVQDNDGDIQRHNDPVLEDDEHSPEAWAETIKTRHRNSDAYYLLEEGIALLMSACASPIPDDITWPGGWRGVNALEEDIQRLFSIGLSLYEAKRYPPTDRIERAIETIGVRVVHGRRPAIQDYELSNVTGWRMRETSLENTTAHSATKALRELAIESWHAGFARRSLLTIRRLVSIIALVVQNGDVKLLEELDEDLQLAVTRTARIDDDIAERERSRQLVLSLAPELMALGRAPDPIVMTSCGGRCLTPSTRSLGLLQKVISRQLPISICISSPGWTPPTLSTSANRGTFRPGIAVRMDIRNSWFHTYGSNFFKNSNCKPPQISRALRLSHCWHFGEMPSFKIILKDLSSFGMP